MSKTGAKHIYTIPPGLSFADTLAAGLIEQTKDNPESLPQYLIFLPTRRACRSLQTAFLQQNDGAPILLPRMQTFGDIDADELSLSGHGAQDLDIKPAISPLKRQIMLAKTIHSLPEFTRGAAQDMALAKALGELMDQIYTEDVDIRNLPSLVEDREISAHWQITVRFLEILSEKWPEVLAEEGVIDAADRRNQLLNALNTHWQKHPPSYPVIAAGSTGSIPATAALLKTISALPKGSIILPGLDKNLSDDAWNLVDEGHPQATLKQLLDQLECHRDDIRLWPHAKEDPNEDFLLREKFVSWALTPPEKTDDWQKIFFSETQKKNLEQSLQNVKRYDCNTPQDEAGVIALLMRETLEIPQKTASLITTDRQLAKRVAVLCRRWNIDVDDSGGFTLADSSLGIFIRLCAKAAIENIKPCALLSLLKHEYCHGGGYKNYRSALRTLERDLLHGVTTIGFEQIKKKYDFLLHDEKQKVKPRQESIDLINHLDKELYDFVHLLSSGTHNFSEMLRATLQAAEVLATSSSQKGEEFLWRGEVGEKAVSFFADLQEQAAAMPPMTGETFLEILEQLMRGITIRPRYGLHPRLMILGQLEARLIQADRLILAGLNEGNWPPDSGHDPWMSRPMRKQFGLPVPERMITLAAHDFVQAFCNKEVFLTRSKRVEGTPTVPARWLQRIDTFMHAIEMNPDQLQNGGHLKLLELLNETQAPQPVEQPKPCPPLAARPRKLSVTKIEKWLQDPYSIYAEKILRLRKLDPLEKQPGASEKGILLHDIMEKFTTQYRDNIPDEAVNDFITISRNALEAENYSTQEWYFWMPRMIRLAEWLIPHEQEWREGSQFLSAEAEGEIDLKDGLSQPFTLTARADRIDRMADGTLAIIDYKSGNQYSGKKMISGELPQLPLEAIILEKGGFENINTNDHAVGYMGYWKLTGGSNAGDITALEKEAQAKAAIENATVGILNLIQTFDNENVPYIAIPRLDKPPSYNDYEYLERVKEWAALGENSGEAA